jgi:hypothetical protein
MSDVLKCKNCGESIMDNGTVPVHLKLVVYEGKPTVLQTQWCDAKKQTIAEVEFKAEPVAPQLQVDSVVNAAIQAIEAIRASCEEDRKFRDYHLDKPFSII